jgi:FAD binding domain
MSSNADVVTRAAASFTGELLRPSDAAYEQRRRVHNGAIDRRPAMIACCRGVADVVDAIRLARATGLELSVRGGGHNVAGRAVIDGPDDRSLAHEGPQGDQVGVRPGQHVPAQRERASAVIGPYGCSAGGAPGRGVALSG